MPLANICYALNVTLAELFSPMDGVSLKSTGSRRTNAASPLHVSTVQLNHGPHPSENRIQ